MCECVYVCLCNYTYVVTQKGDYMQSAQGSAPFKNQCVYSELDQGNPDILFYNIAIYFSLCFSPLQFVIVTKVLIFQLITTNLSQL